MPRRSKGLSDTSIDTLIDELQRLYRNDSDPWVIGYSGGKDSTAVTQLTWKAIAGLPEAERKKPVYVVTTDTLVENPVVSAWVEDSLRQMEAAADEQKLPFRPQLLRPAVQDSYWVNLLGKGYPAPRHKFRWCTERLKIKPTSTFIESKVSVHGEVVLFLGARSAESSRRASSLNRRKKEEAGEFGLSPHPELAGCLVYTPISDWTNEDVWYYLLQFENPWGNDNDSLMAMYRGATADNECPVVVDTSTPSCGNSRFGCWVCTLVDEDKSMSAMIHNDYEKEWLLPLLEFRNFLDFRGDEGKKRDRSRRDFRRITGALSYYGKPAADQRADNPDWVDEIQLVPGPYVQETRATFLRQLLEVQQAVRSHPDAPETVRSISLITLEELHEIRRIWLEEKHEIEDLLPSIYETVIGKPFPLDEAEERRPFSQDDFQLLRELCGEDSLKYEMIRNLLDIEWQHRLKGRRVGVFGDLRGAIRSCFFQDEHDALAFKRREVAAREITSSPKPIRPTKGTVPMFRPAEDQP